MPTKLPIAQVCKCCISGGLHRFTSAAKPRAFQAWQVHRRTGQWSGAHGVCVGQVRGLSAVDGAIARHVQKGIFWRFGCMDFPNAANLRARQACPLQGVANAAIPKAFWAQLGREWKGLGWYTTIPPSPRSRAQGAAPFPPCGVPPQCPGLEWAATSHCRAYAGRAARSTFGCGRSEPRGGVLCGVPQDPRVMGSREGVFPRDVGQRPGPKLRSAVHG